MSSLHLISASQRCLGATAIALLDHADITLEPAGLPYRRKVAAKNPAKERAQKVRQIPPVQPAARKKPSPLQATNHPCVLLKTFQTVHQ